MKLSAIIIGLALLASALPSYAGGIMMMCGGVASTGCASGTVPVGNISETHDGDFVSSANALYYGYWTASASCSVTQGRAYIYQGWGNPNCKLAVYSADGNTQIGVSNATAISGNGYWAEFTFASSMSIVNATSYHIGLICDGYTKPNLGGGTDYATNTGGSYATPPATISATASNDMSLELRVP